MNVERPFGCSAESATRADRGPWQAWLRPSSGAARLRELAPMRAWGLVFIVAALAIVITQRNADSFVPDSRYYVAMAYDWAGWSQQSATFIVLEPTDAQGWSPLDSGTLFGWDLVKPRVIYPALYAPFVPLGGVQGMYVVPIVSMMFLVPGTFGIAANRYGATAAMVPSLLVCCSFYMIRYGSTMLTEGPAAAIGAAILMTLPFDGPGRTRAVAACGLLIVELAFTRQAAVLPAAGIFTAWLGASARTRSLRNQWTPFVVLGHRLAVSLQVAQPMIWSEFSVFTHYKGKTITSSTVDAVRAAPDAALDIVRRDVDHYIAKDRALFLLLALAVAATAVLWRRVEARLMAGVGVASLGLNFLNTTPAQFRYAMPILSFMMLGVAALVM